MSKIFERTVFDSVKTSIVNLYGAEQHAFRPLGSTTSALIAIHDAITSFMESSDNLCVRVTCLDFSKAFDRLPHRNLIECLEKQNFSHGFLLWIGSFLSNRVQRVSINDMFGPVTSVCSGVPQGSVLGPPLFALFIANLTLTHSQDVKLIKYADDLTLVEACQANKVAPFSLDVINKWAFENKMLLNHAKCQQMIVSRTKHCPDVAYANIELSKSVNILGVTLSNNLKWDIHFDKVLLSANRRLHVLRLLKSYVPKNDLLEFLRASIIAIIRAGHLRSGFALRAPERTVLCRSAERKFF